MTLPNPIHYWSFDETSGNTASDSVGGLRVTVDKLAVVTGKWRGALKFGGTDGAKLATIGAPDRPPPWSLSVWVKREKETFGTALLSSERGGIKLEQWGRGGKLGLTKYQQIDWNIDQALPVGAWAHLVIVSTTNETKFYVNGALAGAIADGLDLPLAYLGSTTGWVEFAEATLEDLKIFKESLTPEQVTELHAFTPITDQPQNKWVKIGDSAKVVASTALGDGRFVIAGVATDGKVWTRRQTVRGGEFGPPRVLGEKGHQVALRLNADGRLALAYVTPAGECFVRTEKAPDGDWDDGQRINGTFADPLFMANPDGRLMLLLRGTGGGPCLLWVATQPTPGAPFGAAENQGGDLACDFTAAPSQNGLIHVFVTWADRSVRRKTQTRLNGPIDGPWTTMGGAFLGSPAAILHQHGEIEVYTRGLDNGLYASYQQGANGNYTGWNSFNCPGNAFDPSAINTSWRLAEVYTRKANSEVQVMRMKSGWGIFTSIGGDIRGRPAPAANSAGTAVFAVHADGTVWMYW